MNTIKLSSLLIVLVRVKVVSEPSPVKVFLAKEELLPLLAVDAIVTESADASVVSVMFEPATKVKVSLFESAATFDCPLTAIVPNAFPPDRYRN